MKNVFLWMTVIASLLAAPNESQYCGSLVHSVNQKMPQSVDAQYRATQTIPIEKTIPADYIFFKSTLTDDCPNGFSGLVMYAGKGYIVFISDVTSPKEQVVVFPTTSYKGNFWFKKHPEIRTLEPETDPPRPGDKDYKADE